MVPLVLTVDDDIASLILMKAYLKDENFSETFESKSNGQDALDYLHSIDKDSKLPAVIFLDINMPVLGGWGFLEGLDEFKKTRNYQPVVVMVSATTTPEDTAKAAKHPLVFSLVKKPLNSKIVCDLMQLPGLAPLFEDSTHLTEQKAANL